MDNEEPKPEEGGQSALTPDKLKHRVLKPGESFGNFRVVKCLCAGLIANYYHMQHIRDLHDVTVAIFHHRTAGDAKFTKRLLNLQKTIKGFDHEGIPKIRDCAEINEHTCLFLDPTRGQSLSQYFEAHATPGTTGLNQETSTRIIAQLLGVLGYAHTQGLDHHDIDSDMIFVQEDGSIRLLGLGVKAALGTELFESIVSASVSPLSAKKAHGRLSSFDVMSPEYKAGISEDSRVDVYIIGVIGYWLLTARKPQLANLELPSALVQGLPQKWDSFLSRMLHREQDERFQSCKMALLALKDTDDEPQSDRSGYVQRQIDRIPVPRSIKNRGELATRIYRLLFIGLFGVTSTALAAYFFTTIFTEEEEPVQDVASLVTEGQSPDLVIQIKPPVAKIEFSGYNETYIVKEGSLELSVAPGSYTIRASAPQRVAKLEKVYIKLNSGGTPETLVFDLEPAWSEIQIRSEPGASISVIDSRDIEIELGFTDKDGLFLLKEGLFAGTYQVLVEKEGYSAKLLKGQELNFGEASVVDVPLTALPASLTVRTDPPGARILVNDIDIGRSPAVVEDIKPNEQYLVVAQLEDYRAIGRHIKLSAGQDLVLDMGELVLKSAELRIEADVKGMEGADERALLNATSVVLGDLRFPYDSPELKYVPEGDYVVRMEHPLYVSESIELSLSDRDVKRINMTLSPRPARVELILPDGINPSIRLNRKEIDSGGGVITVPAFELVEFELSLKDHLTMVRTFNLQPNDKVVWEIQPVPIPGPEMEKDWTLPYFNKKFAWIPPGSFQMGSSPEEEGRLPNEGEQTNVTFTKGFWAGVFEVTQAGYREIMDEMPSGFVGASRPVESITQEDARIFCEKLSNIERSAGRLPAGYVYRLPSEAEWEYAARAGTTTPFNFGNEANTTKGNFRGVYPRSLDDGRRVTQTYGTEKVGSYAPNAYGLYDMHGNVSEWTLEVYNGRLPGGSLTNPVPQAEGSRYTIRGGSWEDFAVRVRSAARVDARDDTESNAIGFRVFLAPEK